MHTPHKNPKTILKTMAVVGLVALVVAILIR
jgi:hypothetical protein